MQRQSGGFQFNLDNPHFLIKRILTSLKVVTFVTNVPGTQPVPAELQAALSVVKQANAACAGQSFKSFDASRPDHAVFHSDQQEQFFHHFHKEACELIEPKHLYDTLRQLVEIQKDPAFMRSLIDVYQTRFPQAAKDWALTGKLLLPECAPDFINATFDPLFKRNEKFIRDGQTHYDNANQQWMQCNANKQAYFKHLLLSGGISVVMGAALAGFSELMVASGFTRKQAQQSIELLMLIFALATGNYRALFCMLMVKSVIAKLDRHLDGLPMVGRMAIMIGLYGAVAKAAFAEFDMVNFTVNAMSALGGELAVKIGLYAGTERAPAPRREQFFQPRVQAVAQAPVMREQQPVAAAVAVTTVQRKPVNPVEAEEESKEWFKPGFLNKK